MHTHTEDSETKRKTSHFQLSVLLVILPVYRASRKGLEIDFLRLFPRLVVGILFLHVRIAGFNPLRLQVSVIFFFLSHLILKNNPVL